MLPKSGAALSAAERRALVPLVAIYATRMLGLFLLLPVLALHAGGLPGGTPLVAGLAVGAYGLAQALLQIPFGAASDRLGRKPLIVLGLSLQAAGAAIGALAAGAWGVVLARIVQGLGAVSGPVLALVADLTRPATRTRAMMVIGISIGVTFVAALIAGPWLAGAIGAPGIFALTGLAALAAIPLVLFAVPAEPARAARPPPRSWREALAGRLLPVYAGIFMLHLTLVAVFIAVPFALRDLHGVATPLHWQMYLAAFAASIALTVPMVLWSERSRRPGRTALAGGGLLLAALAAMAWRHADLRVLAAALALYFGAFNFLEARLPSVLAEAAGEDARGAALGLFSTCQFAGAFAGGVLGGALLGSPTALPGVLLMAAGAAMLWLPLASRAVSR